MTIRKISSSPKGSRSSSVQSVGYFSNSDKGDSSCVSSNNSDNSDNFSDNRGHLQDQGAEEQEQALERAVAMYDYDGAAESSIAIKVIY